PMNTVDVADSHMRAAPPIPFTSDLNKRLNHAWHHALPFRDFRDIHEREYTAGPAREPSGRQGMIRQFSGERWKASTLLYRREEPLRKSASVPRKLNAIGCGTRVEDRRRERPGQPLRAAGHHHTTSALQVLIWKDRCQCRRDAFV